MARDGLFALLCAGVLSWTAPAGSALAAPGEDRDTVAAALAVQTALSQGRDFLQHGDAKAAVRVLEEQLPNIGGNPSYLAVMRDAYRAYIVNLKLGRQDAEAARYLQRLKILDPNATVDGTLARNANTIAPMPAVAETPAPSSKIVRATMADDRSSAGADDPFAGNREDRRRATTLLARAEDAFTQHRFGEANDLFGQAFRTDAGIMSATREERWAYCKLERAADRLNQSPANAPLPELEKEVRDALQLTPASNQRLHDFGDRVLIAIDKRRKGDAPAVQVKHTERDANGWACAETTNFRIFHNQSRELAEQVAQTAEQTRTTMASKWFGGFKEDWSPRCDIYLHATAQDYARSTGAGNGSPGHSSFKTDGARVLVRRIDLHCEDPKNMLNAVLPHEATHVVLAGQFGEQPIPRWADEGMAVLTEPREKIDRHLRNLVRCQEEVGLFKVEQMMKMADYPQPKYITLFYAQSVSLVEFLSDRHGPETFTKFLRAAQKDGYESALKKFYNFDSFDDVHKAWKAKAFAAVDAAPATGVAQGGR